MRELAAGSLAARNHGCLTAPSLGLEHYAESPTPCPSSWRLAGRVGFHQNCSHLCETEKLKVSKAKENRSSRDSEFTSSHNCVLHLSGPQFPHRQHRGGLEDYWNPFSLWLGASLCVWMNLTIF